MNTFQRIVVIACLALLQSACSMTPAYERPGVPVPTEWDQVAASQPADRAMDTDGNSPDWWTRFGSDELDALMSEALTQNHDIVAASARIDQARASTKSARSRLLPYAVVSATSTHDRQNGSSNTVSSHSDDASLTASYELDLWGANRAGLDAAQARLAASGYDRDALYLVLQAQVASTYFQGLALKDRLAIAESNLQSSRQLMQLIETRFENGAVSGLDVAQQKTALLSIEAEVPALAQSLSETQYALAVLLGRVPQGFRIQGASLEDLELPVVAAGQPTELLKRRPDIRSAEASLIAANADVGAARAALFPGVNISASVSTASFASDASSLMSLAGQLVQVLFDGGSRRADIALNEAERRELAEVYAQTWLTSLQEVQVSLSAIANANTRADLLEQTAEAAQEAYRLATERYQAGSDDLLSLLTTQQSLLSTEDNLAQAKLAIYVATSDLFKALGGQWDPAST